MENISKKRLIALINEYKRDVSTEEVYEKLCDSNEFSKMCNYLSDYLSNVSISNDQSDENYYKVVSHLIEPELEDPIMYTMWSVTTEALNDEEFINLVKSIDSRFVWVANRVRKEGY